MKKQYALSSLEKYEKQKEYTKLERSEQRKLLDLFPTLFSSSLGAIMQYPNITWGDGSLTFTGSSSATGVSAFSSTTHPVTVPYVVSLSNWAVTGSTLTFGAGMTNTSFASTVVSTTGATGTGWNDSALIYDPLGAFPLTAGVTSASVQLAALSLGNIFLSNSNILTIQEYRPFEIFVCLTDSTGTIFSVPWTRIAYPWSRGPNETRCLALIWSTTGSAGTAVATIVATPSVLVNFNS